MLITSATIKALHAHGLCVSCLVIPQVCVMGILCRKIDPKATTIPKTQSQTKDKDKCSIVESNGYT